MEEPTAMNAISELVDVVAQLRDPKNGCPWDLAQNHNSLIPFLIEEAYEVVNAIRHEQDKELIEELGDLLLQVVLHAQIAKEEQRFSLKEIAQSIKTKLIRRHPHVFSSTVAKDIKSVKKLWESIKKSEQSLEISKSPISDNLRRKIRSQPALSGAMRISKEISQAGFEWPTINNVFEKVNEEIDELKEAIENNDKEHAEQELGDVLFTLVNVARWCKLDPEEGLASTNIRFIDRFSYIENYLGEELYKASINELKLLWQDAKRNIKEETK